MNRNLASAERRVRALLLAFGLLWGVCLFAQDVLLQLTEKVIASAEKKYGPGARVRLVAWTKLIADNRKKSEADKLKLVNDFFNQVPYVSDMENWNVPDYWATPVEMLASNGGDCEDYAIGKYFTLLALGFPMERLRINYVLAPAQDPLNQAHMVLTYYPKPDAVPFVLDNLVKDIKLASARSDLVPVYSFNGEGLWLAKERASGRASGSSSKIGLWAQMNERMGKELQ
jgi:predicted transglutaminase-like cysteine proteinase